jgi:hypothetical protein
MDRRINIGVTASRNGLSEFQMLFFVRFLEAIKADGFTANLHHGDCVGGDAQCHQIFDHVFPDGNIIVHPPEKDELRAFVKRERTFEDGSFTNQYNLYWEEPKSYFARNRDIVGDTTILCGFPIHNNSSGMGGTWYTINHARKSLLFKEGYKVVYKIFDERDWDKRFDNILNTEWLISKGYKLRPK